MIIKTILKMKKTDLSILILSLLLFSAVSLSAQRKKAPMYFSAYAYLYTVNQNQPTTIPLPEDMWQHNIDYIGANLSSLGFDMICTDGWGEDVRNSDGFRVKHHSIWTRDFAYWGNYAKAKGVKLGLYEQPLWINDQVASTKTLYDPNEKAMWFHWLQVNNTGAEDYMRRYIEFYKSFGVDYLRCDFLSWYEDGKDKDPNYTILNGRSAVDYQKALGWLNKYCDANDIQLSLVMPHLYNHGINESTCAPGSMIRVNEDACSGTWNRFSDLDRGIKHDIWSQYWNAFDGFVFWSDISGFDDTKKQMILDGDFIWLSSYANDDERRSVLSLNLMAGGAIAITEYAIEDLLPYYHLLENSEIFALNADGFVGKPVSRDLSSSNSQIWTGKMSNGDIIIGLFNRETTAQTRFIDFSSLGVTGNAFVRDLWDHTDLDAVNSLTQTVPSHGCKMYRVSTDSNKVFTPQFSINGGNYVAPCDITLTTATTDADIYYTIDGTNPTSSSNLYSGTITVFTSTTLKAIAIKQGMSDSYMTSETYKIGEGPAQSAMYVGGTFDSWYPGNVPMKNIGGNSWKTEPIYIRAGNQQMKFANSKDWTKDDWGNTNGLNGTAKLTTGQNASNISFLVADSGQYVISFNDFTLAYSIQKIYSANQLQMYVAGTFSNWNLGLNKMNLTGDNLWTVDSVSITAATHQLKFANTVDWTKDDWGNSTGFSGTAKLTTGGSSNISFTIPQASLYTISFNDKTLGYSIFKHLSTDVEELKFIKLSPNPVSDELTINTGNANSATITVYSVTGCVLYNKMADQSLVKINLKDIKTNGLVFVKVTTAKESKVFKILIE